MVLTSTNVSTYTILGCTQRELNDHTISYTHTNTHCPSVGHTIMDVVVHTHWQKTHTHTHIYNPTLHAYRPSRQTTEYINLIGFSNNTHPRMETLTDFLLGLGEREAAQLTHGASFPLLLFPSPCCYPPFFLSSPCSKIDRWSERVLLLSLPLFLSLSPLRCHSFSSLEGQADRRGWKQQKKKENTPFSCVQPEEAGVRQQTMKKNERVAPCSRSTLH